MTDTDALLAESHAYQELELLRWGRGGDGHDDPFACPHCGVTGRAFYLQPADGLSRPTRNGNRTARRVWKCGACRQKFSVLTGTGFARAKISAEAILALIFLWIDMRESGREPSPRDVARAIPNTRHETAYRAWSRIMVAKDPWLTMYREW